MRLKSPQTPPGGIEVRSVLVEEASAVARELYLSITLDRALATHVVMASEAGGVDIEEVAARTPDKIIRQWAASGARHPGFSGAAPGVRPGARGDPFKQAAALIRGLFALYLARDASLAEVNPLVVTRKAGSSRSTPSSTSTTTPSGATRRRRLAADERADRFLHLHA